VVRSPAARYRLHIPTRGWRRRTLAFDTHGDAFANLTKWMQRSDVSASGAAHRLLQGDVKTEGQCALAARALGLDSVRFTRYVEGLSVKAEIVWTAQNVGPNATGSRTCPDDERLLSHFRGGYGATHPCVCNPHERSLNCRTASSG